LNPWPNSLSGGLELPGGRFLDHDALNQNEMNPPQFEEEMQLKLVDGPLLEAYEQR
jgi:hypothetical protein